MLYEKVRNLLVETIVQKLQPSFILLFGSFAKGTATGKKLTDDTKQDSIILNIQRACEASIVYCE